MGAVFFNKGENCIAAGRLFVEESIHDEFVTRVVRHLRSAAGVHEQFSGKALLGLFLNFGCEIAMAVL